MKYQFQWFPSHVNLYFLDRARRSKGDSAAYWLQRAYAKVLKKKKETRGRWVKKHEGPNRKQRRQRAAKSA